MRSKKAVPLLAFIAILGLLLALPAAGSAARPHHHRHHRRHHTPPPAPAPEPQMRTIIETFQGNEVTLCSSETGGTACGEATSIATCPLGTASGGGWVSSYERPLKEAAVVASYPFGPNWIVTMRGASSPSPTRKGLVYESFRATVACAVEVPR
jgi:hypothetical protein